MKEVKELYLMDSQGVVSTVGVLGIIKVDKKFKKDGRERYVTNHYMGDGTVRCVNKNEIGKFFFYTKEDAKKVRLEEFTALANEYQKRIDKIKKVK